MLISTPARTIPRFDRVALAQAACSAPPRAARVVPWAAVSLFYVFLEDARLFLAVVICVREPSQKSAAGHASAASVKAEDAVSAQSTSKVPSPRSRAMRPG